MDTIIQIGVDIGKLTDYTAIAVAESREVERGQKWKKWDRKRYRDVYEAIEETEYTLRHIERLPLGTSYPKVATRIADILEAETIAHFHRECWIDVTGVGRPVFDMVESIVQTRQKTRRVHLHPITFTQGEEYNRKEGNLGKGFFVSRILALLQNEQIHAPDTEEVRALIEEMKIYERRISQEGHATYGAMQSGMHDDMVTALGLACLEDSFAQMIRPLDPDIQEFLQYGPWH